MLLASHLALGLFHQALHHVAADVAGLAGGQVAVVALLQVDAQLVGYLVLNVVQGLLGLGHHGALLVAGLVLVLIGVLVVVIIHMGLPPSMSMGYCWPAIWRSACSIRRFTM